MKRLRHGKVRYFDKDMEQAHGGRKIKLGQCSEGPPILWASVAHTCPESQFSFGESPTFTLDHVVWVRLTMPLGSGVDHVTSPGPSELGHSD